MRVRVRVKSGLVRLPAWYEHKRTPTPTPAPAPAHAHLLETLHHLMVLAFTRHISIEGVLQFLLQHLFHLRVIAVVMLVNDSSGGAGGWLGGWG